MLESTYPSVMMPVSSKEFLDIQATIECGFTLKRICDMVRTYSHFFCIIQCNIGSCCVHITGDRNLFMRVFQSISPSASCVCVPV